MDKEKILEILKIYKLDDENLAEVTEEDIFNLIKEVQKDIILDCIDLIEQDRGMNYVYNQLKNKEKTLK